MKSSTFELGISHCKMMRDSLQKYTVNVDLLISSIYIHSSLWEIDKSFINNISFFCLQSLQHLEDMHYYLASLLCLEEVKDT
jgi:hypothetical protein